MHHPFGETMKEKNSNVSVQIGPGFCGLLAILFIGLKLTDHIAWSWLWVLSPLWIPFAIAMAIIGACFAVAMIMALKIT